MDIAIDLTFLAHGGRVVATVTDPDGNVLGLLQDR
jgi:hypothetical protein